MVMHFPLKGEEEDGEESKFVYENYIGLFKQSETIGLSYDYRVYCFTKCGKTIFESLLK